MTSTNPSKTDITSVFKRLKSISANKQCFDCGAMNPTWASVTYGVFLCIDCSAVHRSLGVHITFIRSIQLDTTWTWFQLRAMQIGGNANAKSFFEQHNCTTSDSHLKYKSRAAQMYREKLHASAMKTIKSANRLHLDSTHSDHDGEPISPSAGDHPHKEFFSDHDKHFPETNNVISSTSAVYVINSNNSNGTKLTPTSVESNLQGPNIMAALSTSPNTAHEIAANHKSTIVGRTNAKKGLGVVKKGGLGAQRVKTNFDEVESAALQKEKEQQQQQATVATKEVKADKEETNNTLSMNLMYKELSIGEGKRDDQMKKMDAKKKDQVERLGMASSGVRVVSHSATSDMKCINQENPTNGSNPYKLDKYMTRSQKSDDFEIVDNLRSLQIKSSGSTYYDAKSSDDFDSMWTKKNYPTQTNDKSSSVVSHGNDEDRGRSRKTYQAASDSTGAQEKFGNAKSISSEQFFSGGRDAEFEVKQNLRNFEGKSGISSSDLFGGGANSGKSASAYYYSTGPDLADIKEGVRQGISKVAGRLSNLANDVMGSMQKK